MAGKLYVCATPIGNLEDMTMRAIRILKEADRIAAEDTRHSVKLLNYFNIETPMTSYHEHNKYDKAKVLVELMLGGETVALITDAGMPAVSDPGEELVRQCHAAGIEVVSVPGASACVSALSVSGQPSGRFCFEAFLPSDKKERARVLECLKREERTIVLYEAPHRLKKTLEELKDSLGNRELTVCRELTKIHEETKQTTLDGAIRHFRDIEPKGEFVLVIRGRSPKEDAGETPAFFERLSVREHVDLYIKQGMDRKEAMKAAAQDRGVTKRDIYRMYLDFAAEDKRDI